MLSVNYNPSVLKAQNNLTNATSAMTKALERMSTGFKINSAKDDAAGMFVATKLTTQIRGLLQARNNANDGISYISTASESLTGMGKILNRIRDLAVQGANGVYNTDSRNAMQSEADELTKELYRIKNSTIFNGQSIFGEAETSAVSTFSALKSSAIASVDTVPAGYTAIYTAQDLDNVRNNLSGKYILMNDIDLSGYANWDPIGDTANYFTGELDGNGHVIKNMKIDRESEDYVGLFGSTNGATIKNVGLKNIDVKGGSYAGGLSGFTYFSTITNSYAQGNVSGNEHVGGLVGRNYFHSTITNSYAQCTVSGDKLIGGLVGENDNSSTISTSYA